MNGLFLELAEDVLQMVLESGFELLMMVLYFYEILLYNNLLELILYRKITFLF